MFLISSEAELVKSFRPRDRKSLELPTGLTYPFFVRDYHAWVEATGARVFLVFEESTTKRLLGLAFRRDGAKGPMGRMCDWCHSHGSGEEVGLLTTAKSSKRVIGVWGCLDLRCGEKLQEAADLAGRSSAEPRRRLLERMERFAHEGLGIQAVPAA